MAAAHGSSILIRLRKRSFFFALSADQKEFRFPGSSRERLTLRVVSLGFGARDNVHVLEAEGSKAEGEGEHVKMLAQTTAMLGVQPSIASVNLSNTVLTPPVIFRLRSGPGPMYVSGSHLVAVEEADLGAPVMAPPVMAPPAMAPIKSIAKTPDEPALKRPSLSSYVPAQDRSVAKFAGTSATQGGATPRSVSSPAGNDMGWMTEAGANRRRYLERLREKAKTKIMESVAKGVKLSNARHKFERFLLHCHNVREPDLVRELWRWRKTMK